MDSLILCKFSAARADGFHGEAADMLRHVTGWDVTPEELRETARRIVAAKREVNAAGRVGAGGRHAAGGDSSPRRCPAIPRP